MRSVAPSATCCLGSRSDHCSPTVLHFDNQADTGPLGTVGVGNSSRAATAILAFFFLCEPTRLGRRPSPYNAAYEEAPSGQDHSHGVLPYWKAADEDGSSVIHGRSPFVSTRAVQEASPAHPLACVTNTMPRQSRLLSIQYAAITAMKNDMRSARPAMAAIMVA